MMESPTRYTDVLDWLDLWWSWAKDLPDDETPPLELSVLDKLEAAHQQASELPDVYSGVRLEPLKEFLHELRRYYDPFATHLQPFRRQYGDQQASRDELLTLRGLAIANMREVESLAQQAPGEDSETDDEWSRWMEVSVLIRLLNVSQPTYYRHKKNGVYTVRKKPHTNQCQIRLNDLDEETKNRITE